MLVENHPERERLIDELPAGDGPFNLSIRLNWPKEVILSGSWQSPALERVLQDRALNSSQAG